MRKWILALLFTLLPAVLVAASARAEVTQPQFDQKVIMAQPGETVHFTYSVPEGYEVTSETWQWFYSFTIYGYNIPENGTTFFNDNYGGLPSPDDVTWDGEGGISCQAASCIICVRVTLNGAPGLGDQVEGFVCIGSPTEWFEYEVYNGSVTITGRHDELLESFVIIPDKIDGFPVTAIGDRAFYNLPSGKGNHIFMPDSITAIGEESFAASAYISAVRMSPRLRTMGRAAFAACLQMNRLRMPDSLTVIPDQAFINCWNLNPAASLYMSIGRNIVSIGDYAFAGCYSLGTPWKDKDRLPESLVSIGEGAFQACTAIKSLEIPAGVTVIRDRTFQGCESIASISIDGALTAIGVSAFENCEKLESITIPATVGFIGENAFRECLSLTAFDVDEQNIAYQSVAGALLTGDGSRLLSYAACAPDEAFTAPETLTVVDDGAFRHLRYLKTLTLPESFCDYRAGMFEDSTGLQAVYFGEGTLTSIPDRFFYNCSSLVYPTAYTGIASVGSHAFCGCSSLPVISFDETLTTIGQQAFRDCTLLQEALIPDTVREMGASVFLNAVSLETFDVPESLRTIPSSAFSGCTALQAVSFSGGRLQTISSNAFENTGLTSVVLPDSVTRIGGFAFSGCTFLTTVQLPEQLKSLGSSAFSGTGLIAVTLPSSLDTIGSGVFLDCAALTEVYINANITGVPISMFENCAELAEITLPRSVREIGGEAFSGCAGLTQLLLWPDITQIASDAFSGCTGLTISGWSGSAAQAAAQSAGLPFTALDQGLAYILNTAGNGYLVSDCDENSVSVAIPASHEGLPVTGVQEGAFSSCAYLVSVSVDPANTAMQTENGLLLTADGTVLLLCPARLGITGISVPETVEAIAPWAFARNRELRTVTIGAQVTSVGDNAFAYTDPALCLIVIEGSPAQLWAGANGIAFVCASQEFDYRVEEDKAWITGYNGTESDVLVPSVIDGYPVYGIENMRNAVLRRVTVSDGVIVIGTQAFQNRNYTCRLESVCLPDSVTTISSHAFSNQEYLSEVVLGNGVTDIGWCAFSGCESLRKLILPDSLRTIADSAFAGTGLESLSIPSNVVSIGGSFLNGVPLKSLLISEDNTNYDLTDGQLYENSTQTLVYTLPGLEGPVTVREGTLIIHDSAFSGRGITSITLPESLTVIGSWAFNACRDLISIDLPEGLLSIGGGAFGYCTNLSDITLPDSLTMLGDGVFENCLSLTEITIPSRITWLSSAFMYCKNLRSVTLPEGLTEIYNGCFDQCYALETLHLPASLTRLGSGTTGALPPNLKTVTTSPGAVRYASENGVLYDTQESTILFVNASVNGEVIIRDGITGIGENAFRNRPQLTSVILPESCTGIEPYAFAYCTALSSVTLPAACTVIPDGAFRGCQALTDYAPFASVTNIGRSAFAGTGVTTLSLSLPDLVIGAFAFSDCDALTEVIIASDNASIQEFAFAGCDLLESVTFPEEVSMFSYGMLDSCVSLTEVHLPRNITSIGYRTFTGCSSLETVDLSGSVTEIGAEVFRSCVNLTTIHLPDGVTTIGDYAFSDCTSLTEISLPDSLIFLGQGAFGGVNKLLSLVIPENLTRIPEEAFALTASLQSVILPDGIESIGREAFSGSGLTQINLPEFLTDIGERAFSNTPLVSVSIPGGVASIDSHTFSNCTALESVTIAPGVETIGSSAFINCSALSSIALPSSVKSVEASAFEGCSALAAISGRYSLRVIGAGAFYGCGQLREVTVSNELTEIPASAFAGCSALVRVSSDVSATGVILPGVTRIGDWAFHGCKAVPSFTFGDSLTFVGTYAFDSTSVATFNFPDSVTEIGDNAIWRNYNITSVHLPSSLTRIPNSMFSATPRMQTLLIPSGVRVIGAGAFATNTSFGALKLPDGLEEIGTRAFANASILLEIPASVTTIAPDAFYESNVEFYTPEGSTAHQFAMAHNIPVHLNQSVPAEYLQSASEMAASIVSRTVTEDMTVYQKAEALIDWMVANIQMDGNLPETYSGKYVLVRRAGSRWAWTYGYKALLDAANITNDIYFTADGIVEGHSVTNGGAVSVNYFSGAAINMIMADGGWYFTYPAHVSSIGKISYFMLNRDLYRETFHDDPNVENCDHYDQTFLYHAYSKDIEQEVVAQASASFAEGNKLVFAEVSHVGIPLYDFVFNYAGMHMDTLTWNNAQGEFEPAIIGTDSGYWLSDDLTGEYAEVVLPEVVYTYGDTLNEMPESCTATLCGLEVEGTLSFEETAPDLLSSSGEGKNSEGNTITATRSYQVTFVPWLSEYVDTLAPTVFTWKAYCKLPQLTDAFAVEGDRLMITLSADHLFIDNGLTELSLVPVDGDPEDTLYLILEDNATQYENGVRSVALPMESLRCDTDYMILAVQAGEGCLSSEPAETNLIVRRKHSLAAHARVEATCTEDGTEAYWSCDACGKLFADEKAASGIESPVSIGAKGHDWTAAEYVWSDDNASVTATRICNHDASHTETETVDAAAVIISPAEETAGSVVYTSDRYANKGFSVQTKSVTIPALKDMSVVYLPDMLSVIEEEAFANLACEAVIIPAGCTEIGERAFAECTGLLYIRIPASVQNWPDTAFDGCSKDLVVDWDKE